VQKAGANESGAIVMHASVWLGISSQPVVLEDHANMSCGLIFNSSDLNYVGDQINAG
jgi:hypothetical protein